MPAQEWPLLLPSWQLLLQLPTDLVSCHLFSLIGWPSEGSNSLLAHPDENGDTGGFAFYSSFHKGILVDGLVSQYGRGYAWTTFGGPLACVGQKRQCALTALMPYNWYEAPWQSPLKRALKHFHGIGLNITEAGELNRETVLQFCSHHTDFAKEIVELELPECEIVKGCKSQ